MNVLPDADHLAVQESAAEFLRVECPTQLVRVAERDYAGHSKPLWDKFSELGWMSLCLPEELGGQGLPLTYLGFVLESVGRYMAPLPVYSTMVPALVIANHGSPAQRSLLARVASGKLIMSFAIAEQSGRWSADAIQLVGRRDGEDIVLTGSKCFVDQFVTSEKCMVTFRLEESGELVAAIVDTSLPGIQITKLLPMAKDSESLIHFNSVRVSEDNIVGSLTNGSRVTDELMQYASLLLVPMMQGAARHAMEIAVKYVNFREAFGQPIGAFQAIQHMAADMLNAVDGTQLLSREALWRLSEGLPADIQVSQAKAFANDKCLMVCRSAQQMHGGIGFIEDCDINLWYRRVSSWSLRGGTSFEHRSRIASALFDRPGKVRMDNVA